METKIKQIRKSVEETYALLNERNSEGLITMLDTAYPEKDGEIDAEIASELLLLRDSLQNLLYACQANIEKINETV